MLRIESSSVWTQLFVICNFRVCMSFLVVIHVCLYVALLVIMLTYLLGGVLTCQFLLFNMWRKVIYGHELQLLNYYVESSVSTWFVCCSCCFLLYPCQMVHLRWLSQMQCQENYINQLDLKNLNHFLIEIPCACY